MNEEIKQPYLSEASLIRMSRYLNVLEEFKKKEIPRISTRKLADRLAVNPAVVKQDFLPLKVRGQTGVGYDVSELLQGIRQIFLSRGKTGFAIVGFGNIGQAIANYESFVLQGFELKAIFDINPKFYNYSIRGIPVEDIDRLTTVCDDRDIDIGVICTPAHVAQDTCDRLVACGVKGIWNFAPTELVVPGHIILVHEHLTRGLLTLAYHIGQRHGSSEEEMSASNRTESTIE